jgi:Flp pilus assembly protein TadG
MCPYPTLAKPIPQQLRETTGKRVRTISRRGSIVVLTAFLLPVLLILTAFAINVAYLQLTRTELMVATDSAARAGGRAMSAFQDVDESKTASQVTASMNLVAGEPLRLNYDDAANEIEFGVSAQDEESERFEFTKVDTALVQSGLVTADSIRINGRLTSDSLTGTVSTLFPPFGLTPTEFDLEFQSVAMQVDRDIALIIDRSGSMLEGGEYEWPPGFNPWSTTVKNAAVAAGILYRYRGNYYYMPGHDAETYQDWVWEQYLGLGEPPTNKWEELVEAVNVFLDVLETTVQNEQVSLSSYSTTATQDMTLVSDYSLVRAELDTLSADGWTAIGLGMQASLPTLLDEHARPFAQKTMVVMTDGIHNTGVSPILVGASIVSQYDITIHTVTFGDDADQALMQQLAELGGGSHYHAATGEELNEVFEQIANNLPTVITQ